MDKSRAQKQQNLPIVKTPAVPLLCITLSNNCTTSPSASELNGSLILGTFRADFLFRLLPSPCSSASKIDWTHIVEVTSSFTTSPSPFNCKSGPKTQTSLSGCLPIQRAALKVSFSPFMRHFLKYYKLIIYKVKLCMDCIFFPN